MNIKPLNGRVLMKRTEIEEKQDSLIITPEAENKPYNYGRIVAASDGKLSTSGEFRPTQVKVGDVVITGKYVGTEMGNEYVIVHEDDILGIVEDR